MTKNTETIGLVRTASGHAAALKQVADTLMALRYDTWNFGDSVGFEALLEASRTLGDPTYASYAHGWARSWASRRHPFKRMDCTAPGLAMVQIARETDDSVLVEALIDLVAYLRARPSDRGIYDTWERMCLVAPYGGERLSPREAAWLATPPNGTCLDCLHFDPPFFAALGELIGDSELVDDGAEQALAYVAALQQADGTFDHFFMRGIPETFGGGWGRGQGWAMLGLIDVLEHLPSDHFAIPTLRGALTRQIDAMKRLQRSDGKWWCVVDDPSSGEEGSTAAFMATAFLRAIRLGFATRKELEAPARAALGGALSDVDENGFLRDVTAAVMASTKRSHYAHTPRGFIVTWGQGPVVLALAEAAASSWFNEQKAI
jgi:unsaturated rhamnogalacturonyl hydrolase